MQHPTFSVIIPTYNRVSLLAKAMDSVLAQTFSDLELIVIDDGSNDGTAELVQRYTDGGEHRVRYLWQENSGKSAALNNALMHARGRFLALLDSDDTWSPEKLRWQLDAIQTFGKDCLCFTDAKYVNNPELQTTVFAHAKKEYKNTFEMITHPVSLFATQRCGICFSSVVISFNLLSQLDGFDTNLRVAQDTDFIFRLALITPFCVVDLPLVDFDRTVNRRDGLIDLMTRDERLRLKERQHMYEKWLRLNLTSDTRTMILARLAEVYSEWCNWHLMNNDYREAGRAMSKSLKTCFMLKSATKWALTKLAPGIARGQYIRRESKRAQCYVIS